MYYSYPAATLTSFGTTGFVHKSCDTEKCNDPAKLTPTGAVTSSAAPAATSSVAVLMAVAGAAALVLAL